MGQNEGEKRVWGSWGAAGGVLVMQRLVHLPHGVVEGKGDEMDDV